MNGSWPLGCCFVSAGAVGWSAQPAPAHRIVGPGPAGRRGPRSRVQLASRDGPADALGGVSDRWFDYFDRDGNGLLRPTEAVR